MAHSPEIFYRLPSLYEDESNESQNAKPFFRAADDYYPDNPASHGAQIVACAFNSLLFGHVCVPDWDMFTTTIKDENILRMHAISRCLSGGPIYLSDSPSSTPNKVVLDWICCRDGTTFPCRQAAVPTLSSLFVDHLIDNGTNTSPLAIWNTNGGPTAITSGIVGVFHLGGSGSWDSSKLDYVAVVDASGAPTIPLPPSSVELRPSDIPYFAGTQFHRSKFLAVGFFSKVAKVLASQKDAIEIQLLPMQSEAVTVYPIVTTSAFEFVAFGMQGRINGAGAVQRLDVGIGNAVTMEVRGCGEFVVAARPLLSGGATPNVRVIVDGTPIQHHLLLCNETHGPEVEAKHELVLRFGFDVISIDLPPGTLCHHVVVD